MKNSEYYPVIIGILENDIVSKKITVLFSNYEIKSLDFVNFCSLFPEEEIFNKKMLDNKNIKNIVVDFGTLHYPDFDYTIDPFSIYDNSEKAEFKSEYLQIIRKLKGVTQKDLAKQIKIQPSELSKVETGKINNLQVVSKALVYLL